VARELIEQAVGLLDRHHGRPRLRPAGGIVDRELIIERVSGAREALDDTLVLCAESEEQPLVRKIRRLDDQGAALPVPPRVAVPWTDVRRQMRTAIERNDPTVCTYSNRIVT
jgi:hypothetical protein